MRNGMRSINLDIHLQVEHLFQQSELLPSPERFARPIQIAGDQADDRQLSPLAGNRERGRVKLAIVQRVGGAKQRKHLHQRLASIASSEDGVKSDARHGTSMISRQVDQRPSLSRAQGQLAIVSDHPRAVGWMIPLAEAPADIVQQRGQPQRAMIARAKGVNISGEIEQLARDEQDAQLVVDRLELATRVVGRELFAMR
jgi:hypothetical protein